jgi:hypothetical protein
MNNDIQKLNDIFIDLHEKDSVDDVFTIDVKRVNSVTVSIVDNLGMTQNLFGKLVRIFEHFSHNQVILYIRNKEVENGLSFTLKRFPNVKIVK